MNILGGKNGQLICSNCGGKRYAYSDLCPDCWGKQNDGGTRNMSDIIIQAPLPKKLWSAIQFAATMMRNGTPRIKAITIASKHYKQKWEDVQSGLSQRSGRCQKGRNKP